MNFKMSQIITKPDFQGEFTTVFLQQPLPPI